MEYHLTTRRGKTIVHPTSEQMRAALQELETEDGEHPDCWLTREDGWSLSIHEAGYAGLENLEGEEEARHLPRVTPLDAVILWELLARGDLTRVLEWAPWVPGPHPPVPEEKLRAFREEAQRATLAIDRTFYNSLGEENPASPCQHDGCARGTVRFSIHCRRHHFESVCRKSCPFTD